MGIHYFIIEERPYRLVFERYTRETCMKLAL
jgi:hypothetical protein